MEFLSQLICPITKNSLRILSKSEFQNYPLPEEYNTMGNLTRGLLDSSEQYFYPILDDIIVLLPVYAVHIGDKPRSNSELSFDKKRVFDYYNEINYKVKDSYNIYEDSNKWVDFREVSSSYIKNSFTKAARYYPSEGAYFLDIASGPIGLTEYMKLSNGYSFRVCIDISVNALVQAKANLEKAGKKGIYICGDITNIPLKSNSVDTVLSQHTLYHIPKDDQELAVRELYRVAKPGSKIVIIYSWFYHSWMMNISLGLVQVYRVMRHYLGKLYLKVAKSKPRLYYYAHSPKWFLKTFEFSDDIEFHCWRSTNKYFLNIFVHKALLGKQLLDKLIKIEDKHSRFMSKFGEYSAIVITKKQ